MQYSRLRALGSLLLWVFAVQVPASAATYSFHDVDYPGAVWTVPSKINDSGDVVGTYQDTAGMRHGFVLKNGVYTTVNCPAPYVRSSADGINNLGDVVGTCSTNTGINGVYGSSHSYILSNGVLTFLPDVPGAFGGASTFAADINDGGDIVGTYTESCLCNDRGFLLTSGSFTILDAQGFGTTIGEGINNGGSSAGGWQPVFGASPGHGWVRNGVVFTTTEPPSASASDVNDLDESGRAVGEYFDGAGVEHGFIFDGVTYTTIDHPAGVGIALRGINARGQLTGDYTDLAHAVHGFVATPLSPNGRIAFAADIGGNREIFVINPDGTGKTNITNHPNSDDMPAWSPDGSKIAFVSNRSGAMKVYVMNPDGSGVTPLTSGSSTDTWPSWSPDGARIIFSSDRTHPGGSAELFVMNANGSDVTPLTTHGTASNLSEFQPRYSPDGSRVAFWSDKDGNGLWDIYVMNADGTGVTELDPNGVDDYAAHWTPDGSRLVYYSGVGTSHRLKSIAANGTAATFLTAAGFDDATPAVSPDGEQIAFSSNRAAVYGLCLVAITGGAESCVTTVADGNTTNADWGTFVGGSSADLTPPVVDVPGPLSEEATGPGGTIVTFVATATDPDDAAGPVTCSPASGDTFAIGATTVTCSATDTHGNTGTSSFVVTVSDTTAPALSLPTDLTVEATGPSGATVSFSVSATDTVDGSLSVTCVPNSGSSFPVGSTTVTCSATDGHHNTTTGSFVVSVGDATAPALTVPADIVVDAATTAGTEVAFVASASDLVDGTLPVSCSPPSGAVFPIGATTVTCSATDSHHNTTTGSFHVTVRFGVCLLYDDSRTHKAGSTIPIKVELCTASGVNVSSPAIVVTAVTLTKVSTEAASTPQDAGNANPDLNFRFDASLGTSGGYIFNLQTTGLSFGTYAMTFIASGDPTSHVTYFKVR